MIDSIKNMPDVKIVVVDHGNIIKTTSGEISQRKKIIIFGVPGAFTSTCSVKHLPSYINLSKQLKDKGIDDIYCLSVNDPAVMQAWQTQYSNGKDILMIADGNADLTKSLELDKDYSKNYMGLRSKRFAMVAEDKKINIMNIEQPGEYKVSAAEYIMNQI